MGKEKKDLIVGGKGGRRKIVVRGVREVWPEEKTSRPLKSFASVDTKKKINGETIMDENNNNNIQSPFCDMSRQTTIL